MTHWQASNRWRNQRVALLTPLWVRGALTSLPFTVRWVRRGGHDFECRFFLDGTVVVSCDVLIQTERFLPGEGSVQLDDAESVLIDRILAANDDTPST
ncbi:MAG: hypothetical protein RIC89_04435 [Pseudomonadales bacterium]